MDPRVGKNIATIRRPINRCVPVTLAASIGVVLKPDESCKLVDQYEI
jgi:hypothetical protein